MQTQTRLREAFDRARVERNKLTSNLLGTVLGEMTKAEKNFRPTRPLSEKEEAEILKASTDSAKTTHALLVKAGRLDAAEIAATEISILESFMPDLPPPLTAEEIEDFAKAKVAEGANMGAVMAAFKSQFPDRYDGKTVSGVVKRLLG